MIELEYRYRINSNTKEIKKKLDENYDFLGFENQKDLYFKHNNNKLLDENLWLSLRNRNNSYTLNIKKYSVNDFKDRYSEEIDFKINDYNKAKRFFELLGYKTIIEIIKSRNSYKTEFNNTICLDIIETLGCYIEIEKSEKCSYKNFKDEIVKIEKLLKLSKNDIVTDGYVKLSIRKNESWR